MNLLASAVAALLAAAPAASDPIVSDEVRSLLRAALDHVMPLEGVVVLEPEATADSLESSSFCETPPSQELLDAYNAANREAKPLPELASPRVLMRSTTELAGRLSLDRKLGWLLDSRERALLASLFYPGVIRDEALVQVNLNRGDPEGESQFLRFRKRAGQWALVSREVRTLLSECSSKDSGPW